VTSTLAYGAEIEKYVFESGTLCSVHTIPAVLEHVEGDVQGKILIVNAPDQGVMAALILTSEVWLGASITEHASKFNWP
jgi:hypothetical protein